jgi:hypothetical protein
VVKDEDYDYDYDCNYDDNCEYYDEHRPCQRYNQRRGGRYDSEEDQSRSVTPDPQVSCAFGQNVSDARYPS